MPNNIYKYCDPQRPYNKTVEGRYLYVWERLRLYKDGIDDKLDLNWNLKDAVVGEINFSKKAMELLLKDKAKMPKPYAPLFDIIHKTGRYKIIDDNGDLHCEGLRIYDIGTKWWNIGKPDSDKIYFEHVIPTNCYLDRLLKLYDNSASIADFTLLMKSTHACIVLKDEDKRLNQDFRKTMPAGWEWGNDPYARYRANDIAVWLGL